MGNNLLLFWNLITAINQINHFSFLLFRRKHELIAFQQKRSSYHGIYLG